MKKNLLSLAVAAGLTVAGAANAVFVNPEGHGQVLLYPYYTIEGGKDTYINLVNTTDQTKAVKVRFVEAMNSQEVLDFNLYLSPQDHWSAVITRADSGEGAVLKIADTSCTVPNRLHATTPGVVRNTEPFRNYAYLTDKGGSGDTAYDWTGIDRTREGYVEIIEMGVLDLPADQAAVKHDSSGVPASCATVAAHWASGGKWAATGANTDLTLPSGGLYGYGVLIDVAEGTNATYDALALDDFISGLDTAATPIHYAPGTVDPSLNNATPVAHVLDASAPALTVIQAEPVSGDGIDAVSAVLMHSSIANDYVLEPTINAGTDWVVTFPTKKQYVNSVTPIEPFTSTWNRATAKSCEPIAITYYDREERGLSPDPLDVSPPPPAGEGIALCREANIISFNSSNVLEGSSRVNQDLAVDYQNGWMEINFAGTFGGYDRILETDVGDFVGLPVIGFAVQKYVNGALDGGVLSNYAGTVQHKGKRTIQ